MTDKELLELAAKAAGIEYDSEASKPHPKSNAWFGLWLVIHGEPHEYQRRYWNPLTDDGDVLRLAVKLEMLIHVETCYYVSACKDNVSMTEHIGNDGKGCLYAATRRAIVRAAAEIGKTK